MWRSNRIVMENKEAVEVHPDDGFERGYVRRNPRRFVGPTPGPVLVNAEGPAELSAVAICIMLFIKAMIAMIAEDTNKYRAEKYSSLRTEWKNVSVELLIKFLAALIHLGINKRPGYRYIWSISSLWGCRGISDILSRSEFERCLFNLHCSGDDPSDKLNKIRQLISSL